MANSNSWKKIFDDWKILETDFSHSFFHLTAEQIKRSCQNFKTTSEKEVRILCKQDSREDMPEIFRENGLFILPLVIQLSHIIFGGIYANNRKNC